MSVIDTLIFDRTQSDIANDTDKAYIDFKDLNRIEEAIKYLSDILKNNTYYNKIDFKVWDISDIRNSADKSRIRGNFNSLKDSFFYSFSIPTCNWEDINDANNIERILYNLDQTIKGMEGYFVYSGVANSGQTRLVQNRFRRTSDWNTLRYSLDKYNLQYNNVTPDTSKVGSFPSDSRNNIKETINVWNKKIDDLDKIVGVIE